jgi:hypothetical protein
MITSISSSKPAPAEKGTAPLLEAAFDISNLSGNPFDYTENDIEVTLGLPGGKSATIPAFFDGGTTWRIRYTPLKKGHYTVKTITRNGTIIAVEHLTPSTFDASSTPNPGFIRIDPNHPTHFAFDNKTPYYPIGHDVAWSSGPGQDVTDIFPRMGAVGENWSRVWMNSWDNKNLDWPAGEKVTLGQLSLTVAKRWDSIFQSAEQNGIYFQMTLQHHGQYSSTVNPNWPDNPWNRKNGGFLDKPEEFFTSEQAKHLTKAKYRYIIARWGYSPNLLAWELFNEVQFTDAVRNGKMPTVAAWHKEMAEFLRSQDINHHLITTSSDTNLVGLYDAVDYIQPHSYPPDVVAAALSLHPDEWKKPIFFGEIGPSGNLGADTGSGLHRILWGSLMSEASGAAQYWAWDNIHRRDLYQEFPPAIAFVAAAGLAGVYDMRLAHPTVTTPGTHGSLSFAPGGGWGATKIMSFPILPDGGVQDAGKMPEYLQGKSHAEMFPAAEFPITVDHETTFSVQVGESAKAGAHLLLKLDGAMVTEKDFPAADSNTELDTTVSLTVPPGNHTIRMENTGADWARIFRFTLTPFGSTLRVATKANSTRAVLWVQNTRTDGPSTGSIALPGLKAGKYRVAWWDTTTGKPLSETTVEVADGKPLTLTTPSVEKDLAAYVIKK